MIRSSTRLPMAAAAGLALLVAVPAVPAAAAPSSLAAHRAVYEIDLADASERSGIEGMTGRMVYDFGGSSCDGYTTSFRFVTRIATGGDVRLTDQQTTTFESVEDGVFQFATRSFVDRRQDRDVKGIAEREDGEGDGEVSVELTSPEERALDLPATAFPTQHMLELLEAAKEGEALFERDLFDGSDDADRVLSTTAVIGRKGAGPVAEDLPEEFEGVDYWPVAIAYYTKDDAAGEALPLYRIEFDLYENGVTREIVMDYGDFTLTGTLSELEMREMDACE